MTRHRVNLRRRAGGYTLLEVLMAVTIVMIITSLAWTPLMTSWGEYRLNEATENVRSVLAGSRIRSLENDQIWQFRYEPGGDHYLRLPYESMLDGSQGQSAGRISQVLPEGFVFEAVGTTTVENLPNELLEAFPDSRELSIVGFSGPLLFYPDGTASSATFRVVSDDGAARTLSVRRLTGSVSVRRQDDEESTSASAG